MHSYHASHHAHILTLSDVAERGKSIFIISLAPFGAAFLVVPIHVPLETRHVAGLGPFEGCAAYDYRWLSVTCKRARMVSGNQAQLVLSSGP